MLHEHVAGIRLAFGRTCHGERSVGNPPTQWETTTKLTYCRLSKAMPPVSLGATYLLGLYSTDIMHITRGLASAPNGCIAGGPLEKRCCWLPQSEDDPIDKQPSQLLGPPGSH